MRNDSLILIQSDVFDIADRIKEVDEEYRLYYDIRNSRYEVRKKGELCVTWTEPLSAALVTKLRETHVRRRLELLKQIERDELRAQKEAEHRMREAIGEATERFLSEGSLAAPPRSTRMGKEEQ